MSADGTKSELLANRLRKLFAEAKLPTNPALAARILTLTDDPKSGAADFADVLRADPALSTRLLKMANSVQFAQQSQVTTIPRAITVLGLNRVKTVSLAFELITHLDRLGGTPFDMKMFWQHSLLRACLARSVAQRVIPERAEEAFLIGLLLDCGILLLVQVYGCSYASLYRSASLSPTAFHVVESKSFPHTHVQAIEVMASEWMLPAMIATPLARHHHRPNVNAGVSEMERLSAIAYFVGGLRFVDGLTITPEEQSLWEFGTTVLELNEDTWNTMQQGAAAEYQRVSSLYGNIMPEDVDIAEVLGEANRQLASVVHYTSQRVLDVEAERAAIQQEQRGLENALREYRERAALDPLTNVLNRGAVMEAARRVIEQHVDEGMPIGALFLDLDDFKQLNDTHGHDVGDKALKAVAGLLIKEVGHMGAVGRYGGEEFVVVLRGLSADTARKMSAQIVTSVRDLDCNAIGYPGRITCSLGAVWSDRPSVNSAEELFAAADQLMYKAKRAGKDCYLFGLLAEQLEEGDHGDEALDSLRVGGASRKPGKGEGSTITYDELAFIANKLNEKEVDTFTGIRKQGRKKLTIPCIVHYFTGDGADMRAEQAATRNISTGGIALLLSRPLSRGEAIEVVLDKGPAKLFLAGLVSFCRHIVGGIHEVGVQFVTHSVTPIIFADASDALQNLDWVAQAMRSKQTCSTGP